MFGLQLQLQQHIDLLEDLPQMYRRCTRGLMILQLVRVLEEVCIFNHPATFGRVKNLPSGASKAALNRGKRHPCYTIHSFHNALERV